MTRVSIVHLITGLGLGGAEHALVRLVTAMDRTRFETRVVSLLPDGPLTSELRDAEIDVVSLDMSANRPSFRAFSRLVGLLRSARPDVLQTWLYHADLLGLLAGRLAGIETVAWNLRAADMDLSRYRRHARWTLAACVRLSRLPRGVIVNSQAARRHHEQLGYRPREWVVIPNGVDLATFKPDAGARRAIRQELSIPQNAPVVGLLARWDPMKDHETFFRAAARLSEQRRDAHFVLAGDGVTSENADFWSLRQRLAPAARIAAIGPRRDVPRVAAALDISTCSSMTESFPNVVVESMSCGVPCVVTDVGDAAEIVGDTGLVVPPRSPEALADAWLTLLGMDDRMRAAWGARARARVAERYTLERAVSEYESFYERVTKPALG